MAKKELHTADIKTPVIEDVVMPELDEAFERDREIVKPTEEQLQKEYADALQFMEEPLAIRIEPSSEDNPPLYIDCWVNGKGCEIFDARTRQWLAVGAFPVGKIVVTRRKYVEVLARAKRIKVKTLIVDPTAERPENRVQRTVSQHATFSVIEDRNPKGAAWLRSIVGAAA